MEPTRRDLLTAALALAAAGCRSAGSNAGSSAPLDSAAEPARAPAASGAVLRPLGRTGIEVEPVSLGGEGILRSTGRERDAVPMIEEALRLGVRYCDTAPAYQHSQDYYGMALRNAGPDVRRRITLASKTHERERDAALRLLDDSLRRLGTDYLDIWQLHDLRTKDDLDRIFARDGAIAAFEEAKADGRVRHVGVTGHHDPLILVEALRRYPVDSVLCAMNPADPARSPFLTTIVTEARARGVAVVGMKSLAAGRLPADGGVKVEELIRYAASHADTVIIGCSSIAEVRANLAAGRAFTPLAAADQRALEGRLASNAARYDWFKA